MNSFIRFTAVCCAFFVLGFVLPGCGGDERPPGFPKLYPVSLQVLQEGAPLADAAVSLRISDNSMTWSIGGRTDEQGIAVLWTHGRFRGAPEGAFKVSLEKVVNEGEDEMLEALNREDLAAAARIRVESNSFVKEEYNSFGTTPIEIEITPRSRMIEIDAGPAVKIRREYLRP